MPIRMGLTKECRCRGTPSFITHSPAQIAAAYQYDRQSLT